MKKVVILRASGNELANQLWNYASIYAYTLERKYQLVNPSFFEYGEYFSIPAPSILIRILFFLPFKNYTKRKGAVRRRVWRKLYLWYTNAIIRLVSKRVISYASSENVPFYLPPTNTASDELKRLEQSEGDIYLDGWLFRNPTGLEKYREKIVAYIKPKEVTIKKVSTLIQDIRRQYPFVVGVHIRQGDYRTWRGGAYFIDQTRVKQILDEYLSNSGHSAENTHFIITSDGPIDENIFSRFNMTISKEHAIHDLFLLSSTNVVIGSNSTFGAFASYYGNIPFIVMQKEQMDWEYYHNKAKFFENKYSTMVHY